MSFVARNIRAKKLVPDHSIEKPFILAVVRSHGVQRLRLFINDEPVRTFGSKMEFIQNGAGIVGTRLESRQEIADRAMNGTPVTVLARRRTYFRR